MKNCSNFFSSLFPIPPTPNQSKLRIFLEELNNNPEAALEQKNKKSLQDHFKAHKDKQRTEQGPDSSTLNKALEGLLKSIGDKLTADDRQNRHSTSSRR